MEKPIIGIVSRPGIIFNKYDVQVFEETYKNAILKSGGIPLAIIPTQDISFENIIPREAPRMTEDEKTDLNRILNICDAIIIPGGLKTYEYDYYICEYSINNNIPILGICAGMQIMARKINECKLEKNDNSFHYSNSTYSHNIKINKNTLLYDILNKEEVSVNSYHNYHVNNFDIDNISAICLADGIVEAIEKRDLDYYLGVQWHPEKIMDDENSKKIFSSLVEAAKIYRKKK